jgi:uncharacterized protein (DUF1786 family)
MPLSRGRWNSVDEGDPRPYHRQLQFARRVYSVLAVLVGVSMGGGILSWLWEAVRRHLEGGWN